MKHDTYSNITDLVSVSVSDGVRVRVRREEGGGRIGLGLGFGLRVRVGSSPFLVVVASGESGTGQTEI